MATGPQSDDEIRQGLAERVTQDHTFHPVGTDQAASMTHVRSLAQSLGLYLVGIVPLGRELSSALTKLEEVVMHANAGIARKGVVE